MQRQSNPRAPRLRALALGSAVAAVFALPLAVATATPAGPERKAPAKDSARAAGTGDEAAGGLLSDLGLPGDTRTGSVCGPELAAPEGVEAQTCVVTGDGETWGRTYYRNVSGREMDAVVVLMVPDGRNVRVTCRLDAGDEPGVCDTPRESSERGEGTEPYAAVAEFASEDGQRSLLRASSVTDDGAVL